MEEGISERVGLWIDAFNSGDVEAMAALADPGVEWVIAREHPATRTLKGPEAIAAYLEDWGQTLPGMAYVSEEVLERGGLVLAGGRLRGAGTGSGVAVEVRIATLTEFREGRAARVEEFLDPEEARREFLKEAGGRPRRGEADDRAAT